MIVVTAAIIQTNGKTLAARKRSGLDHAGLWEFPGGKVEPGESPEESLARELREELGIRCKVVDFIGESIHHSSTKSIKLLGYGVTPLSTSFTLADHDQIRWLAAEELFSVNWAPADLPLVEKVFAKAVHDKTLSYYEKNAEQYIHDTVVADMEGIREAFIHRLPDKGHILDLGCGSGRDSKAFLARGYAVTATDASPAIAAITSRLLMQEVVTQKAQDIEDDEKYDGVWACASLLHVPKSEFQDTLIKLIRAVKKNGILYFSMKKDPGQQWDSRGRFFNNLAQDDITSVIAETKGAILLEIFETVSVEKNSFQKWMNVLVRKDFSLSGS